MHVVLGAACLGGEAPFTPTQFTELRAALLAWNNNPNTAGSTYGAVNTWVVTGVTDFYLLLKDLQQFDQEITGWDTSLVTEMSSMFYGAKAFNKPLAFEHPARVEPATS